MEKNYCTQCGNPLHETDKYCASCGTPNFLDVRYAGFWVRLAAALIDGALLVCGAFVLVLILAIIYALICKVAGFEPHGFNYDSGAMLTVISVAVVIITALYEVLLVGSSWQGTVGKRLLGLKVTDEKFVRLGLWRSLLRYGSKVWVPSLAGYIADYLINVFPSHEDGLNTAAHVLCLAMFIVWYLLIVFDKRKRAAHDRIALTYVVRK